MADGWEERVREREGDHGRVRLVGGRQFKAQGAAWRDTHTTHPHTQISSASASRISMYVCMYINVCMFVSHLMHFALSRRVLKDTHTLTEKKMAKGKGINQGAIIK